MRAYLPVATVFLSHLVFVTPLQADEELRKDQVPAAVISAFESAHPGVGPAEYEAKTFQGKTVYKVEYKEGGKEIEILYSPEGTVVQQAEDSDDD